MTPTDHPRLRELLAGILTDPGSDVVRLAYADTLAELGDGDRAAQERAEFVRVQCRIAYLDMGGGQLPMGVGREALRRRERELLRAHGADWLAEFLPGVNTWESDDGLTIGWGTPEDRSVRGNVFATFRRGFVEAVTMPAAALAHLDAVRACQPVTKVTLTGLPKIDYVDSDLLVPYLVGLAWSADVTAEELPIAEGDYVALGLLRLRFPGIEWALPVT